MFKPFPGNGDWMYAIPAIYRIKNAITQARYKTFL